MLPFSCISSFKDSSKPHPASTVLHPVFLRRNTRRPSWDRFGLRQSRVIPFREQKKSAQMLVYELINILNILRLSLPIFPDPKQFSQDMLVREQAGAINIMCLRNDDMILWTFVRILDNAALLSFSTFLRMAVINNNSRRKCAISQIECGVMVSTKLYSVSTNFVIKEFQR